MTKRMVLMLLIVGLLFGSIFGYQAFKKHMIMKSMAFAAAPPVTVTAMEAVFRTWQPQLRAVGSLRAVRGVDVASEIPGLVRTVNFKSGEEVKAGQLLVQLNADADVAQLHVLEAAAELADTVNERDKKQFTVQAVSRATLDADAADLKGKRAQVLQQAALVEKKTIRAPFAGKLGITFVNPGLYLNPGDKIVTLQALGSLYVDFYLPQQQLAGIARRQRVSVFIDAFPGRTFPGTISAISSKVDPDTRNVQIEATIVNPRHELLPGMYASVEVHAGAAERYLTLPQTAIAYNPYGETVYVIGEGKGAPPGTHRLVAIQRFVTAGPTRGDQVAILKGVKEGDRVVTTGQLKLKNGSPVVVNNQVVPTNEAAPRPADE